jgi:heat-inducible transcriptional repressor
MDERIHRVLSAIVETYIGNPDPVGSRFVTKKYAFNLSPATIRNIMADLEEMGFLRQPHTSAGRIPTDKGYRFYVDSLPFRDHTEDPEVIRNLRRHLEIFRKDVAGLLEETTRTLSSLSHYLAVAIAPKPEKTTLRGITLIRYRMDQVVATLITDEGVIQNRIIGLDPAISTAELAKISDYLNREFSGYTLDEIRSRVLHEMRCEKDRCDSLIAKAVQVCTEALSLDTGDVFISGLSEVLDLPDFADLEKIKKILRTIEDKHTIIRLLDALAGSDGVRVVIGSENTATEMLQMSMVVATYKEAGRPAGTIGVIGPTRMDYGKVISIVDTTARYLTAVLTEK